MWHLNVNKNSLATGIGNGRYGGAGYTCWSPRLLLLSPRHSDRHFPRCFSCRNYKQSSQLVLKNHPVSRGRGFDLGAGNVLFSNYLLFFGLDSWIGFDNKHKIYEEIRPAPDTFTPIKDHLPSFLPWQDEEEAAATRKHLENQVFSSPPPPSSLVKIPLISCAVGKGYDTLLRLLRTPKPKK